MATLLVCEGGYHCPECLRPIVILPTEGCVYTADYVGECMTSDCDRRGVRVKIPMRTIEVEELPTKEENPHGAQKTAPDRNISG